MPCLLLLLNRGRFAIHVSLVTRHCSSVTRYGSIVTVERIGGEINGEINEEIKRVLHLILKNGGIKTKAIAHRIGRPKKTVDNYLRKLRDLGKIHYIGSKKTGGYYATKNSNSKQ